jgi:ribosomal protein L18E
MATFLMIKQERLSWATRNGIVERLQDGSYAPEVVTGQWLKYERGRMAKKAGKSEFERQRVRLTKAKAEAAERKLALLDGALLGTDDIVASVRTVCLRIRSKLQAAVPRIARECYHAPNANEALKSARNEFDLLISELSALENDAAPAELEIVTDDSDGESPKRSTTGKDPVCGEN